MRTNKPRLPGFTLPRLAAVFAAAILCAGCSTLTVKTDFDSQIDFAKYKTFKWHRQSPERGPRLGSLLDKRIKLAVERELTAKGLSRSTGRGADLVIRYHASMREKVEITSDWYGWRHRRRSVSTYRYREGTIVIDFVDPQLQQLVWRGWAVGVINDPATAQQKIQESVQKIMEKYPPKGQ